MSVNKPTNIVPPGATANKKRRSLLERASESFGLDRLEAAAVPIMLDQGQARGVPPRRTTDSGPIGAASAQSAAAAPAARPAREADQPAIVFSGERRQVVRALLREQGLIDPEGGASKLLEEFRIIKRQVLAAAQADGTAKSRRVLVCSPHPDEGKTFCALNLAIAMAAERDSEVLLIDADFGKPSIMSKLGLEAGKGFMDVLSDPARHVEDYVVGTDIPGLWVLPAGARTGRDSEYLASERTWEVLGRLTRGASNRILLFDSPPALAATPAAELAKHVGQALLVARADMTGRAALEDAVDLLSDCPDIKLLLNDATFSPSGRSFGSYYGYGE